LLGFFAARLFSSDNLLESSLFDFRKQAVSFCTKNIRSSIGESQELSSLFASLLGFASGLQLLVTAINYITVPGKSPLSCC
jgi:hypothetical protein